MNKRTMLKLVVLFLICTTALVASAGSPHFVGSTTFTRGSLIVDGTVNSLVTSGIPQATVRFVGYGHCYTPSGAYWTPTDPNQMDNDPDLTDDYPETRLILPPGTNKADFHMVLPNPGESGSNVPSGTCAAGTWVWTGATLQLWSSSGSTLITLFAQKDFACAPKGNGDFVCK
jgi:hypothetical protein